MHSFCKQNSISYKTALASLIRYYIYKITYVYAKIYAVTLLWNTAFTMQKLVIILKVCARLILRKTNIIDKS
ncbi:uncharacterized protein METZ01_LOCUS272442 [marine metagenome]|uniref:Uncharacterized protein n=1 Tax=marine metagenome TaxID=408172 RepID=A0A382K5N3_9ZZZZ